MASIGYELIGFTDRSIYRSTNFGESWLQIDNAGIDSIGYSTLTAKGDTLFVVSGSGSVYYSIDTARSWVHLPTGVHCSSILCHEHKLICCAYNQILVSTDFGKSWTSRVAGCRTAGKCVASYDRNVLIVGNECGVYRSTDDGLTWTEKSAGMHHMTVLSLCKDRETLYVGTSNHGVYKSTDEGLHWMPTADTTGFDGGVISILAFNDTVFVGTKLHGMFASSNGGKTWTMSYAGFNSYGRRVSSIVRCDHTLYETNIDLGIGVYTSNNNGSSWTQHFEGLPIMRSGYEIAAQAACAVLADQTGPYISLDNGSTWRSFDGDVKNEPSRSVWMKDSSVWLATRSRGVFHSSDLGTSWVHVDSTMRNPNLLRVRADNQNVVVFAHDSTHVIDDDNSTTWLRDIYASVDGGVSWQSIFSNLPDADLVLGEYMDGVLYAGLPIFGLYTARLSDFLIHSDVLLPSANILPLSSRAVHGKIALQLVSVSACSEPLVIYDMLGREVQHFASDQLAAMAELDVSAYTPGVYFLYRGNSRCTVLVY